MAISYNTLGSTVNIYPRGTVVPGQLNTEVAIVGGYDSANAASGVSAASAATVTTGSDAETQFGSDSELARQSKIAIDNGSSTVHGVPVASTEVTESFSGTSSGTAGNAPVLDPRLHGDKEVTAQDTQAASSVTVNYVDDDSPSQPSSSGTMNFNPSNGAWAADSSSDYDITYEHYETSDVEDAIDEATGRVVRFVGVCTEESSYKTTAKNDLETQAANFRFKRAVLGSEQGLDPTTTGSYTPDEEDWRLIEVAPVRGTSDYGEARLVGAIAGLAASQPVDVSGSITYDDIQSFSSLNVDFTPNQAENFDQVTAVTDEFQVAEGVTTSSEVEFQDIYKAEIIDFIVEQLYERITNYSGGSNAYNARQSFGSSIKRELSLHAAPNASPPRLATGDGSTPYSVGVEEGSTETELVLNVGIDVAPIAKEVILDLSVGPISFGGVTTA